ncbi:MAG: putative transport system permease protein [Micromonosporaceae bacterium]|nr:putative transport system permease protein [Micromonosporaceae bacterium]
MLIVGWLAGLVRRRLGRLAAIAGGIAVAVALLASLGTFLASAKATMTQRSIQRVAVDWQVATQTSADPAGVAAAVRNDPHVAATLTVGYATTGGFASTALTASGGTEDLTTGPGQVLGLPPTYETVFPATVRHLLGGNNGVLLAQQTAANLHAAPGSTVAVKRAGLPDTTVTVAGIVDLPQADSLFQKVGAPVGAQPQAPPDNVMLVPEAAWHAMFDPLTAQRPDLVHTEEHVRLRHDLPSDPAAAYTDVVGAANHLDVVLAGTGLVGDNLGATLGSARSDARYADILFLFLGLPAAVLAGLLTAAVTESGAPRRRREQALLRARGATARQLVRLAGAEALLVGIAGATVGLAVAVGIGRLGFGSASFGASAATAAGWAVAAALIGIGIAIAAVLLPARRDLRATTVAAARRTAARRGNPAWLRYGLDGWLLLGSAVIIWITSRSGYQLVLAPEGVPTISVNYWAFLGPALLWAGAALLTWRLTYLVVNRGRTFTAAVLTPIAGRLSGTAAATLARGHRQIGRAVVYLALAVAFAVSTATFDATYARQSEVDSQLTNGAAVMASVPAGAAASAGDIASVPGVASVEPVQHRFAYVGADLQDMFGIRPDSINGHVTLSDAYFAGATARELVDRLAKQPDAILVSDETVKDFQLHPGDLLRLRLTDARTGQPVTVPFHYAGIVKEFPTAPTDSFLVANASYLDQQTNGAGATTYLVSVSGASPAAVADRVRARLGTAATVTDIQTTRRIVGSSLTAVDLSALTRIELGFALGLTVATAGLLLVLGFAERRRTFALVRALGARPRQLGALVWSEIAVVGVAGLAIGSALGWALSETLVAVLTGVFDPPPDRLTVPWAYLSAVGALALACLALAGVATIRAARRRVVEVIREL